MSHFSVFSTDWWSAGSLILSQLSSLISTLSNDSSGEKGKRQGAVLSSDVYFFNAWLMKFPTLSPSSLLLLQKQRNVIFSSHPPHVPALWVFFIFPCGLSLTFWRPEPPCNSCILTPLSLRPEWSGMWCPALLASPGSRHRSGRNLGPWVTVRNKAALRTCTFTLRLLHERKRNFFSKPLCSLTLS